MFTGLIQGTGKITASTRKATEGRLTIRPEHSLSAAYASAQVATEFVKGESIAVNGACLTVETFTAVAFTAYASAETLSCTNLGFLRQGDTVNLERALCLGDSLGGHMVSGHVDALAEIIKISPVGSSLILRLSFPEKLSRQIIAKGSVALDGISLTVNACEKDFFEVNIIPATQKETTIASWQVGYKVNLETDLVGKYVERQLGSITESVITMPQKSPKNASAGRSSALENFVNKQRK
ncbi:MAG: riboflavin synthase [Deltaproteobacteria bacterium]|jgi:riboflavin synthase|nr:riboflavin synthase [Deltaproteobacteria bacterium]